MPDEKSVSSTVKVLPLTPDDYETMVDLWKRAGLEYRPKGRDSKQAITVQMSRDPELVMGAFRKGRLVGTVIATFDGRRGWVNRLAVDPTVRRTGVGETLVGQAVKLLRERGALIVGAHIERTNFPSTQLFKKCGFRPHENIVYCSIRDSSEV